MKIIVKNISHVFDKNSPLEFKALHNSSCTIDQGEYIAIIGQTGSGKTTFIEHLNSLLVPDEGNLNWIFEHEFKKKKEKFIELKNVSLKKTFRNKFKYSKIVKQHVGIVFQFAEYQLFESTIKKDIMFGPMAFGIEPDVAAQRAVKYLDAVGLGPEFLEQNPLALSGGQKRRVALAGILAIEPDVLILDEPTAGLDPAGVREILEIFDKLNKDGKTIIMVTHDMDNVLERTTRCIVFDQGTIIRDDFTYSILKDENFILQNNLVTPSIIRLTNKIQKKYPQLEIPKIVSLNQMSDFLNEKITQKAKAKNA
ncbi:energy-coupling factor transport system ATP-binding protein [Mycoplasma testudineum]|uniref:Energy-coupling factor transport system ATP-binding protein n=1 Tax=Mycoplasma testudineum TaxID=244584 RepID=A0A4R6IH74_9MOLU|nr:ATP-binding cassette domain-containing protein [Mycoplasma testudineum]OYD27110.1 energy-coupling factor transporter ATPase [Mycoplasma testudineum]TDO21137.1 energy-coupling factor transport system ATP-binding protein [Mycoplasma testudineum]